jgi:hypothetical protein
MNVPTIDVVFLSYDEPLAGALYARLAAVLGVPVKRLHGVRGMRRAYQLTAQVADTDQYLLADADFEVDRAFRLADVTPLCDAEAMRVWRTVNAVNGLTYGYGGLKLVRRQAVADLGQAVDVLAALPGRVRFTPTVAGRTRFNQSRLHAWRAGFRECAMLTRGCEYGTPTAETQARITTWTSTGTGPYADWARAGARDGVAFAERAGPQAAVWDQLNDPAWLDARFAAAEPPQAMR